MDKNKQQKLDVSQWFDEFRQSAEARLVRSLTTEALSAMTEDKPTTTKHNTDKEV